VQAPRLFVVALIATLAAVVAGAPAARAVPTVRIEIGEATGEVNRLHVGVTHTQHSADAWGNRGAVESARSLLRDATLFQNQHLMGWGASNPEPIPGLHDWRSLDARIELVRDTAGTPIITLAASPDWMKGGLPGLTDWSRIEVAPRRAYYDDFARLAQETARRYPEVRHFQVWNELKGFWDAEAHRWRYEDYTDLYNEVYEAVKAVRPDALIGGPYVVIDTWANTPRAEHASDLRGPWGVVDQRSLDVIEYWLEHRRGADFIAVDGSTSTKDAGLTTDPFAAAMKYAAVTDWIQRRTALPVVWSEWRPTPDTTDPERRRAVAANALGVTARAGATGLLLWQPQADGSECRLCLWTDTRRSGGGQKMPTYDLVRAFAEAFPPGARWKAATASSPAVGVLASDTAVLLVNRTAHPVSIDGIVGIDGLDANEVRFVRF
jgi:hypothetical protein